MASAYSVQVNKAAVFIISEHRSEFSTLFRVRTHDVLEQTDVVRLITNLLGIKQDLVVLAQLGKAKNDLYQQIIQHRNSYRIHEEKIFINFLYLMGNIGS